MFLATSMANLCNYVFHIIISRLLGPVDYGTVISLLSVFMILSIPSIPLQTVLTKYVVNLQVKARYAEMGSLLRRALRLGTVYGLLAFLAVLLASHYIASFLHISSPIPVMVVGGLLLLTALLPLTRGVLQGQQQFFHLGGNIIADAFIRLIAGVFLVYFGLGPGGALGASLVSGTLALALSLIPLRSLLLQPDGHEEIDVADIRGYFGAVLVGLLCFTILTNIDIVVVKRFFSPEEAGYYGAASLVGKIILYLPAAVAIVAFPKSAQRYAINQDPSGVLRKSVLIVGSISLFLTLLYWLSPSLIVNILFGGSYAPTAQLIGAFGLAMAFLALVHILIYYHLSIHNQGFLVLLVTCTIGEAVLLLVFHQSPIQVISIVALGGLAICILSEYFFHTLTGAPRRI